MMSETLWLRGHYHCKKCGGTLQYWFALAWTAGNGVRRIGGCLPCGLMMIESERRSPRWIKIGD